MSAKGIGSTPSPCECIMEGFILIFHVVFCKIIRFSLSQLKFISKNSEKKHYLFRCPL